MIETAEDFKKWFDSAPSQERAAKLRESASPVEIGRDSQRCTPGSHHGCSAVAARDGELPLVSSVE